MSVIHVIVCEKFVDGVVDGDVDGDGVVRVGGDDDNGIGSEGGDGSFRVIFWSPSFDPSTNPSGVPSCCPFLILLLISGFRVPNG